MFDERLQRTARTYDGIATEYDARAAPSSEQLAFLQRFADRARGVVGDLGCGPGHHAAELSARGFDVVGLDLSAAMLSIASSRGVPVVRGDLRRPPLGEVGAVWSSAALLHVPREQTSTTLAAWRACVGPGDMLGLSTSAGDGEGWEVVPYGPGAGPTGDTSLERWFVHRTAEELTAALTDAGWHVDDLSTRRSHRSWLQVLATAT